MTTTGPGTKAFELTTEAFRAGELDVVEIRGVEQLSRPFSFQVLVVAPSLDATSFERDVLGQRATLWMRGGVDEARPVHGIVRRMELEGVPGAEHPNRYRVWLAPQLWVLGRGRASRVFQDKTVRQIVEEVLSRWGIPNRFELSATYRPRTYCLQHQESDLAFVRRLLAEEGIFYAFEQRGDRDRETVVFFDRGSSCPAIEGPSELAFREASSMVEADAHVRNFRLGHRLAPGATLLSDFDFRRPALAYHAEAHVPARPAAFPLERLRHHDHHPSFEDMPVDADAATRRLEQLRARAVVGEGESRCRRLLPGHGFALRGGPLPALDGAYTVVRVEHAGRTPEHARGGAASTEVYSNRFFCVPVDVTPRPRLPRPRLQQVMETATVTGPAGSEIHTDEHGRVKVQFHWDHQGQRDEHSSCWIRAMQPWAGTGFGFQFVPRIGMEVLVVFLAGDVDRPMVIGAAYNTANPPPFSLPASKTKSGIRTRSSRGGAGFNELSFEDHAGYERVHLHAAKDHDVVVVNNQTTRVGSQLTEQVSGNRVAVVTGNQLTSVGGDAVATVAGDASLTVTGNRASAVEGNAVDAVHGDAYLRVARDLSTQVTGHERREVAGASEIVFRSDLALRVEGGSTTLVGTHDARRTYVLHVEGTTELTGTGTTELRSDEGLTFRCGESSIRVLPDRIDIVSPTITLSASGASATLGDDKLRLDASKKIVGVAGEKVLWKGSEATVSLASEAKIDGSKVKLKSSDSESSSDAVQDGTVTQIELVDDRGAPVAGHPYVIALDGGEERTGVLDVDGKATVVLPASGTIRFPGLGPARPA